MRVVSLLASGTEMLFALGLQERLVGISHECDHPPEILDRPRVSRPVFDPEGLSSGEVDRAVRRAMAEHGSVYAVDEALLAELRPELILTQAVCEVCAVPAAGVEEIVQRRALEARVLSLDAHTIEEILGSLLEVGRAAGAAGQADDVLIRLRDRLDAVRSAVAGAARPRVLAVEWLDPPFAPGHWVPEMVEIAGGENLLGDAGAPSRELPWEALRDLDPDVLVVMPCGYHLEAARRDADAHAERLLEIASRAVRGERAFVVDASSYFNRSGPRVVAGVEILAGLLHPEEVEPPAPDAAAVWRPA